MKEKLYSYFLVSVQYLLAFVLLFLNSSFTSKTVPLSIFLVGFIIGIYAIYNNKLHNFNIIPEIKDGAELVTHGIYGHIRHPMYFSVALMMLGVIIFNLNIINITIYLLLLLSLFLKANKEEKLWSKKTSNYKKYKQKTKMIIPYIL